MNSNTSARLGDFLFPSFFADIGQKFPRRLSHTPFLIALDIARKKGFLEAPEVLYGKQFALHITDLGLDLHFACEQGHFKQSSAASADLHLYASAMSFLKLASGAEDADSLFFRRQLRMEGDTELGIAVKYWIDANERPLWLQKIAEKI